MDSEMKELGRNDGQPPPPPSESPRTTSGKDDRPLLKPSDLSSSAPAASADLDELERKYAAYVRRDVYGTMGRGDLPAKEKVLLAIAAVTLVPVRLVVGMVILVVYYIVCRLCTVFKAPNREEEEQEDYAHMIGWRRQVIINCGRFLSRAMLFTMGFYWINESCMDSENECDEQPVESQQPGAIVSNHISYLDILYHMSSSFPSFVAKGNLTLSDIGLAEKRIYHAALNGNSLPRVLHQKEE
ncbi:Lysophospholipid acyltransferase LPEAT1 [Acorus calamus]|uniref:Lysophospholipid acyltransferase LPEAT1 n=1 Tax=Acorus calamus TaxID=4465 RepID=A0AAV9CVU2_ACOCL|nr:Lysophospholipid acyltransferase LPEAT1 [Acorus calamus]